MQLEREHLGEAQSAMQQECARLAEAQAAAARAEALQQAAGSALAEEVETLQSRVNVLEVS